MIYATFWNMLLQRICFSFYYMIIHKKCFGFVVKTELVTHQCFGCFWTVLAQCQGFLFFPLFPTPPHPCSEQAEGGQEVGRGQSQESWCQLAKGIFHTLLCQAQQWKLEVEQGGEWVWLPRCLLLIEWLSIVWLVGGGEWLPFYHFFFSFSFLLLLNCLCLDPGVFLLLFFLFPPLSHWTERGAVWVLGFWMMLTHHIKKKY